MTDLVLVWVLLVYRDAATPIPMQTREACVAAARAINHGSRLWASCINRQTGEVL